MSRSSGSSTHEAALESTRYDLGTSAEYTMNDSADEPVLDTLSSGVLLVESDWRIVYGNASAARRLRLPVDEFRGADLRSVCPSLAADRGGAGAPAVLADGRPRRFHAEVSTPGGNVAVDVHVSRDRDGRLIFELAAEDAAEEFALPNDGGEENAALRILARQMAAVADTRQLLTVLCEAAWAQCRGSGAAVVEIDGDVGRMAVTVGVLSALEGRQFPIDGSLTGEAISARGPIATESIGRTAAPLAPALHSLGVGPLLVSPLLTHHDVLGVLVVVRAASAPPFAARELQRLQVIADHASLAVWKSQLLERAQAADSAKGRFLATMSHELRTPLTALTGYGELLADQVIGPLTEPQLDILERMRSVTHHLATMIEEVLAYSSLESGAEAVRPMEFLAADLVQAVAAVVEPVARQKGLDLRYEAVQPSLRMIGDVDKIRQILVNLTGNAVKFTESGSVDLCVAPRGNDVAFEVRDTGVGIAKPDLARLFKPFTQLDTGLTRRHGGTGLGLYISQRLAMLMGGRISVDSQSGVGSRFELVVPRTGRVP
jgi:signal transduction histidine kinase